MDMEEEQLHGGRIYIVIGCPWLVVVVNKDDTYITNNKLKKINVLSF